MSMATQNEYSQIEIARSPSQWDGLAFCDFDDGDIEDRISLSDLMHSYECHLQGPEWSKAFGGAYQAQGKVDFVCLSLKKECKGLSVSVSNGIGGIRPAAELAERFHWCISWNTRTNEVVVHHVEEGVSVKVLSSLTWGQVRDWLVKNQFQLYIHEYRDAVVPCVL